MTEYKNIKAKCPYCGKDIEFAIEDEDVVCSSYTKKALRKSDQDIKAGRVKEVTSVKEMLDEL